jgi:hypothetical protein
MPTNSKTRGLFMASILSVISILHGCAGSGEDVRIIFCKNLTTTLLGPPEGLTWQESTVEIHRPEYAVTRVNFTHPEKGEGQAACYYDYIIIDETALSLANPISAYDTVPYKMTLQGEPVSKEDLAAAIRVEMERFGRSLITP